MKKVLLTLNWYDRALHEGVADYAATSDWHLNTGMLRSPSVSLEGWRGDGLIARANSFEDRSGFLEAFGVPIIDVQSRPSTLRYPLVATQVTETARMAFDFLRWEKGHHCFGFYGYRYSKRGEEFARVVRSHGFDCHQLHASEAIAFGTETERIKKWLEACPTPMAVYCANDDSASWLTSIALDVGVAIPNDLAILGTDNDELVCRSSSCSLSSIETNLYDVGYRAAALLDDAMEGRPPPLECHYVIPTNVVERFSTSVMVVKSPHVKRAIELMESDYAHGLTIMDVVAEVGISQAGLERAFKRELRITPGAHLRKVRMREAARLLTQTHEKISTVGRLIGMSDPKNFSTAFKGVYGSSPRDYRKSQS